MKEKIGRRGFILGTAAAFASLTSACKMLENGEREFRIFRAENTIVPTKKPSETPPPTDTPEPTYTPEPTPDKRALLERYFYPSLYKVTEERRLENMKGDKEYAIRIDKKLNRNRVNFLFLGRRDKLTDSIQIMSLDTESNTIRTITMHRDTQAPEVSKFRKTDEPFRINHAYAYGGILLAEESIESATGLSADFTIVSEMTALTRMVNTIFDDKLEVVLHWKVPTNVKTYPAGKQVINGEDALRLARARYYGTNRDRNMVQQAILSGIFSKVKQEMLKSPTDAATFAAKSIVFFQQEISSSAIEINFDIKFFINLTGELIDVITQEGFDPDNYGFGFPSFGEGYHIKAERVGYTHRLHKGILKPIGGNPNAEDIIGDYWGSSREEVKSYLIGS